MSPRRAVDVYDAALGRMVSVGKLAEADRVSLGHLGLLGSRDAARPVAELSIYLRRSTQVEAHQDARVAG